MKRLQQIKKRKRFQLIQISCLRKMKKQNMQKHPLEKDYPSNYLNPQILVSDPIYYGKLRIQNNPQILH